MGSNEQVAAVLAAHPEIGAWTPAEAEQRMRFVTQRLIEAISEQKHCVAAYGRAEADYRLIYHTAHLESSADPAKDDWNVSRHESFAEVEAHDAYIEKVATKETKMALRAEIDALKTVLEVLRSHLVTSRQLAGGR